MPENKFADKNGAEIRFGATALIPFRVNEVHESGLVHLESAEAYGHTHPTDQSELKGRTRVAFWAEPSQLEATDLKIDAQLSIAFRVMKLGGRRGPLLHLESVQAYGVALPGNRSQNQGRFPMAFWAEPTQIELKK
jgi:hypothetical protein